MYSICNWKILLFYKNKFICFLVLAAVYIQKIVIKKISLCLKKQTKADEK